MARESFWSQARSPICAMEKHRRQLAPGAVRRRRAGTLRLDDTAAQDASWDSRARSVPGAAGGAAGRRSRGSGKIRRAGQ